MPAGTIALVTFAMSYGRKVHINPAAVAYLQPAGKARTDIHLTSGKAVTVLAAIEEVVSKLAGVERTVARTP